MTDPCPATTLSKNKTIDDLGRAYVAFGTALQDTSTTVEELVRLADEADLEVQLKIAQVARERA